jgi:hypothetical protein
MIRPYFDYYSTETFSTVVIDDILSMLDYVEDGKLHIYWCMPGKELCDGLVTISLKRL